MSLLLPVNLHTAFDFPSLKITGGTTTLCDPPPSGEDSSFTFYHLVVQKGQVKLILETLSSSCLLLNLYK